MKKVEEVKDNGNLVVIISLIVVVILVLFFPSIYNYIETAKLPKIEKDDIEETNDKKMVDDEVLSNLHYPIMRSDMYDFNTYYSLSEFKISDMSNNDILLNAFLDIYEGNMTPYNGWVACSNDSKQFDVNYLELRIKNILGKNITYALEDFYVPEGLNTKYAGNWTYDFNNSRYIYNGLCNSNIGKTRYNDLLQFIKAEYNGSDVIVYYYVGFSKLEGNNYTIYSDAKMTNLISSGTLVTGDELSYIFNELDNTVKNIYKYTFKNSLCSYNEYCLYKGEWIDEL